MATRMDLALDAAHPSVLAEFWKAALGYVDEPPPPPYPDRHIVMQDREGNEFCVA